MCPTRSFRAMFRGRLTSKYFLCMNRNVLQVFGQYEQEANQRTGSLRGQSNYCRWARGFCQFGIFLVAKYFQHKGDRDYIRRLLEERRQSISKVFAFLCSFSLSVWHLTLMIEMIARCVSIADMLSVLILSGHNFIALIPSYNTLALEQCFLLHHDALTQQFSPPIKYQIHRKI